MQTNLPGRRWFQFSLAEWLILTTPARLPVR